MPCFIFGAYSAVMAWNRYSAWTTHAARRLLAIACGMYFDDETQIDPAFALGSGSRSVGTLVSLAGIGFEDSKHKDNDQVVVGLGVLNDFSSAPNTHCVTLSVTDERKASVVEAIQTILDDGYIQHAEATRLYGRCRFCLCPMFGRLGLAALQPLNEVRCRTRIVLHTPLHSALRLLQRLTNALRPVVMRLFVRTDPPVIILTDASQSGDPASALPGFSRTARYTAKLGVVLKDMRDGRMYYTHATAPRWLIVLLIYLKFKKTYICQWELVAVVCAYLTFPDVIQDRLVHHFIDNEAARSNCISGYSGKADSALVLHELHVALTSSGCHPWFGFVYSQDNLSDLPSRGEFALLISLGAIFRRCRLPQLRSW